MTQKKKQIKHFMIGKSPIGDYGYPACHCYKSLIGYLMAFKDEATRIRKKVTCRNCRGTLVFRKVKK